MSFSPMTDLSYPPKVRPGTSVYLFHEGELTKGTVSNVDMCYKLTARMVGNITGYCVYYTVKVRSKKNKKLCRYNRIVRNTNVKKGSWEFIQRSLTLNSDFFLTRRAACANMTFSQ